MKATASSPANIAFIKYWGRKDDKLLLPLSTTNSMNLSNCIATTTVEFSENYSEDTITIVGSNDSTKELKKSDGDKTEMLFNTLERIRTLKKFKLKAKVVSKLNFPFQAGVASSAAGISALVAAGFEAAGLSEKVKDKKELSREVRISGSVSAARSVEDGFTEVVYGETHNDVYVQQIADEKHWDLVDIVAVLNPEAKKMTTTFGHEVAFTSPFMKARVEYLNGIPEQARQAILEKDFDTLATLSEIDSINMHAVMMTSNPAIFYLSAGSMEFIKKVQEWREEGIKVFFTFDAGPNPHLITTSEFAHIIKKKAEEISYTQFTIYNEPCKGTQIIQDHLF